ncbi:MAG TPA: class I SAM-dependent methyltransferase [Kofleriaceae bacterium]|nr:class I SAM-dependent methyltransferase [Kofleriaceae bacterium]
MHRTRESETSSASGPARIEFVPYPPTSFPYRDLLVLEHLPLGREDRVCEIGVGSGATTARLARMCAEVTGFEISQPTVDALRYLEQRHRNLRLVAADVTDDDALAAYQGRYDRALSCDTLEHVADPAGFFRGLHALLAPGGSFAVTFPNEPPDRMHGITRFDSPMEIYEHAEAAGLAGVRMGAARLTPHAEKVARTLGWRPLSMAREVVAVGRALIALSRAERSRRRGDAADEPPPQTFEETRFFRTMRFWRPLSPAVNLYWFGVLRLMAARGPSFEIDWDFTETSFTDCQVFITGHRRIAADGRNGSGGAS